MAKDPKQRPMVVSRHGTFRFQTGMITASLLQQGLKMDEAYPLARELRTRVAGRERITGAELERELEALVQERLGRELEAAGDDRSEVSERMTILVEGSRGRLPYSRGVLLRRLQAVGLGVEPAVQLLQELEATLVASGREVILEGDLDRRVTRLLNRLGGRRYASRYEFLCWLKDPNRRRPLLLLVGGATGTGKSTLAMELGFRLGIRKVISTDMIRETMRTVLPADVVPGLHDHSFRGMLQGGQVLSDPRERVLAGFHQQVAQVSVGVRAVLRRAIREGVDVIVEGTHVPADYQLLVEQPDAVQTAGILLAVPHESTHLARFPKRGRGGGQRGPDAYLDAFQSVRWIHDDLLAHAEDAETLVLGTGDVNRTALAALDYLCSAIDSDLPGLRPVQEPRPPEAPSLLLLLDGLADEPHAALAGRTPLAAADTPHFGALAGSGAQGQLMPAGGHGGLPHTESAVAALFGLDAQHSPGRGLCDAVGAGVPLAPGSVVFRGNVATLDDDGNVVDRRAGRPRDGVAALVAGLERVALRGGLTGGVYPVMEHRLAVVLNGPGLSAAISNSDPGSGGEVQRFLPPRPLDGTPEAGRTAEALRELLAKVSTHLRSHPLRAEREAAGALPITGVLTRGAARADERLVAPARLRRGALVGGCCTTLGLARIAGLQAVTDDTMTANLDTNLKGKFKAAADLLESWPYVVLHVKATDIAAHDKQPVRKREMIEAVDSALGAFLAQRDDEAPVRVVVTADHGTSSTTGAHLNGPVPLLYSMWPAQGGQGAFDEDSAERGALGLLEPSDFLDLLLGVTES